MTLRNRSTEGLRSKFDKIYDECVVGGGFFESDEYYKRDKMRYWRSLELLCDLGIAAPARILEVGGGQLALLCKKLFDDDCTVGDISERFVSPLLKHGIKFLTLNLMEPAQTPDNAENQFDVIILLEVIEHIPLPAYVVLNHIRSLLKPKGMVFLTTPNLFRIRNLARMFFGFEFLDRFMLPAPGYSLGHQLEYSANHLEWQLRHAGMEVVMVRHDQLGHTGHSFKARFARRLLAPFYLRSIWREGLVAVARER